MFIKVCLLRAMSTAQLRTTTSRDAFLVVLIVVMKLMSYSAEHEEVEILYTNVPKSSK